jgi:flagellar basal body-associated protein FliL
MAEEKGTEKQKDTAAESTGEQGAEKSGQKGRGKPFLRFAVMAGVLVVCAGAGFTAGRLFGSFHEAGATEAVPENNQTPPIDLKTDKPAKSQGVWYYDLEPVVANLDEPGVTRYIRATLTLGISAEADQKKATVYLDAKRPLLANWLTIYLASLSLDDVRGDKNLRRVQSQILDAFNEKVFPEGEPRIETILYKEFAIQ